jgi:2-polyprenyl-6-methoxyphenol hydroxylase-like FAD-dependent oxidoreductase
MQREVIARRFAVIGSGIAGLLTAHGLRRLGHEVTLFSDRTPEQWLHEARPTGTAARFEPAMAYERELGLAHWEAKAPKIVGAHLVYCPKPNNRLATMTGRQDKPGVAIDVRLQSHRWMHDLEAAGGRVVIESVSVERLDAIAAEHDLTIVAAGKSDLTRLFERDPVRSVYSEPRRNVAMVIVKGPSFSSEDIPFIAVKNNILEGFGEAVWIPYFHRDVGPCWNLIFEAKPGSPMDVFQGAKTGQEALGLARRIIDTLVPWDAAWAKGMELADEQGWLVGRVTPTVRKPVGRLPSGRIVTCVGDTAAHFDPLAAQGANNGTKMAKHLVERVAKHGDGAFDEAWMTETFDLFWEDEGRPAYELTNLMLESMTRAGQMLLVAQYGSNGVRGDGKQKIADTFAAGFADPRILVPVLTDVNAARRLIEQSTGKPWVRSALSGAIGIARAQARQMLGMSPGHPSARSPV